MVKKNFRLEKYIDKRGGGREGVPRFCIGTFQCLRKKRVSKKFMDKSGWEGGREYEDIPSRTFCLRVPKAFVKNPLVFL